MGGILSGDADQLVPWVNNYLARSADTPLPRVHHCNLGTLRNINLCHLVEFEVETKVSCDFLVTIHNVQGMKRARVTHLAPVTSSTRDRKDSKSTRGVADVVLEITFGVLSGTLSMVPLDRHCGLTGKISSKLINCVEKHFTVGSSTRPVRVKLLFSPERRMKFTVVNVDLGTINIDCLRFLPEGIREKIAATISEKIQTFLQLFFGHATNTQEIITKFYSTSWTKMKEDENS